MTDKEIFEKIQKIISSAMGPYTPIKSIKIDTDLVRDFNMDSLDTLKLFYDVKKEFNFSVSSIQEDILAETFMNNPTVQTLVDMVAKALKETLQQTPTIPQAQNSTQTTEPIKKSVPDEQKGQKQDSCALKRLFNRVKQRFGKITNNQEQNTK